ncbi:unnamed protein product [Coccothraustes coccothraustes]
MRESIRPSSQGRGEERLSDSGMRSLLCHLLLARARCIPAITRGLWKRHSPVPILPGWRFSGLYLGFLGRSGVLLVVTRTKTCDSIGNSSVPPGHGIMSLDILGGKGSSSPALKRGAEPRPWCPQHHTLTNRAHLTGEFQAYPLIIPRFPSVQCSTSLTDPKSVTGNLELCIT